MHSGKNLFLNLELKSVVVGLFVCFKSYPSTCFLFILCTAPLMYTGLYKVTGFLLTLREVRLGEKGWAQGSPSDLHWLREGAF